MLLESIDLRLFVSSYTLKSCQYTGQSGHCVRFVHTLCQLYQQGHCCSLAAL